MLSAHQPRLVHAIPPADHVVHGIALDRDPLLIHPASAVAAEDYNRHDLEIRVPRKEKNDSRRNSSSV